MLLLRYRYFDEAWNLTRYGLETHYCVNESSEKVVLITTTIVYQCLDMLLST